MRAGKCDERSNLGTGGQNHFPRLLFYPGFIHSPPRLTGTNGSGYTC